MLFQEVSGVSARGVKLVRAYQADLEEFAMVRFEIQAKPPGLLGLLRLIRPPYQAYQPGGSSRLEGSDLKSDPLKPQAERAASQHTLCAAPRLATAS